MRLSLILLSMFASASASLAQSNMGGITGVVTDTSGASVAGAQLRILNRATGVSFSTRSNDEGLYLATSLLGGSYLVETEAPGFKKSQSEVILDAGQRLRVDFRLELGQVTETIEVQGSLPTLKTETSEISNTVTFRQIQGLPLNGRNPYYALALTPGMSPTGDDPGQLGYGSNTSMNGSRIRGSTLVVDGVIGQLADGTGELIGSIESVQEMKALTSTYAAEHGRTAGGVVITQIKSGTQEYHGAAYEFHRNSALAANNWENNAQGVPQSRLIRNEYGLNLGGPVPKLKGMFFFYSYEALRDRIPVNRIRTIPDLAIRNGNFSGRPVIVNDPLSGAPFPGNVIPQSRLDPAALKFLQLFPEPNAPGAFNSAFGIATNNWIRSSPRSDYRDFHIGRWDYAPNERNKFFATYWQAVQGPWIQVDDFAGPLNTTTGPRYRVMRRLTANYTHFFSPNFSMEFLASIQRDPREITPSYPEFDVTSQLGIARKVGPSLPTVNISGGYGSFGNSTFENWISQPAQLSQSFTVLKGRHTMKFGAQLYQTQFWYVAANGISGQYNFNGDVTGLGTPGVNNPINALADLQLGLVKSASYPVPQIPVNRLVYNFGAYIQDDWKITNKLTLNLGLRYEFDQAQIVKNSVYSAVDLATGNLLVAGRNASHNLNRQNDYVNFSPRVGFAYSMTPKTVIRSGFAVFHNTWQIDNGLLVSYPGFTRSESFPDLGLGRAQTFRFQDGFPVSNVNSVPDPLELAAAATPARPLAVSSFAYSGKDVLPYNLQWNFGIQRDVGFQTVIDLGYVGSRSVHLSRKIAANNPALDRATEVVINRVPLQNVRPYNKYTGFTGVFYDGLASYHSLQLKATRRFSNGLSVDGNYTFSKNMDNASDVSDSFQIPWQFAGIEKSLSSIDRTHMANIGWVYDFPFGRGQRYFSSSRIANAIFGGFQFNGLFNASSGVPFTITQRTTNTLLQSQRPNVVDPGRLDGKLDTPRYEGRALRILAAPTDPAFPFRESSSTGIGNLGRNTSREPGFWHFSLGLFKSFTITERVNFQLRFEAYNALNHVNYLQAVSYDISNPSYGLITAAAPARQLQLGARLSF